MLSFGSTICTRSNDKTAKLWDIRNTCRQEGPKLIAILEKHSGLVKLMHIGGYKKVNGGPSDRFINIKQLMRLFPYTLLPKNKFWTCELRCWFSHPIIFVWRDTSREKRISHGISHQYIFWTSGRLNHEAREIFKSHHIIFC